MCSNNLNGDFSFSSDLTFTLNKENRQSNVLISLTNGGFSSGLDLYFCDLQQLIICCWLNKNIPDLRSD